MMMLEKLSCQIWKSMRKILWIMLILCLNLIMISSASTAAPMQTSYADYEALSKYESLDLEDESRISKLCNLLPMLDNYGACWFSVDTSAAPYRLRIRYEQFDLEKSWIPYSQFTKDSNALLLFRYIHNLEQISMEFYSGDESIPREQRIYEEHDTFQRVDFEAQYGDLNQLTAADLEEIIQSRRAIDDSAHYNRVRWGSPEGWVTYRNSDPDLIKEDGSGPLEFAYYHLGDAHAVYFLLNDPECVEKGLTGVYQIHVVDWDSEISWHCGLTSDSVQAMLDILGEPQSCIEVQNGASRYMYPVYGEAGQKYIYFDCLEGQIIAHGLGYGLGIK